MLFSEIKAKLKSVMTELSYQDELSNYVVGMLEYPGVPVEEYGMRLLDYTLLADGKAALCWSDVYNRWITGSVTFDGNPLNEYGLLPDAIVHDEGGHEYKFKDWANNEKCFVFFNDLSHNPDISIERYADFLAKIDVSLNAIIVNSRMSPMVCVRDATVKKEIEDAIQANHDGHTEVVKSKNILDENEGENNSGLCVVNITDVNASDKIQYLNHAHDDIMRRFVGKYGLNIAGTGKMAQQSIEEVNGNSNYSLVTPNEMRKSRNLTLKRFTEVTKIECSCEFADPWKREEKEAIAETDKQEAEADKMEQEAEAPEEEPAGEPEEKKEEEASDDSKEDRTEV